jgi:hypothetical protein
MKTIIALVFLVSLSCWSSIAQTRGPGVSAWPHRIPCRISDASNRDLFVMTLGDVAAAIADGFYDPLKDEVTLKDGTVKSNYYRETRGLKYFKPIDKSRFALPPDGAPGTTTIRTSARQR